MNGWVDGGIGGEVDGGIGGEMGGGMDGDGGRDGWRERGWKYV